MEKKMNLEVKVKDCMQTKVKLIDKTFTVASAAKKMMELGVSSFLVKPEFDGDTFGIVTRKDLVEAIVSDYSDEEVLLVEDVMTHPAITISPEISIHHAHQIMRMVGVRRLPVVREMQLVGILSNSDILSSFVRRSEETQG
jgi:signal-transduction protein with cAMP-binding, CBS, and nucleotidyltransferase domain